MSMSAVTMQIVNWAITIFFVFAFIFISFKYQKSFLDKGNDFNESISRLCDELEAYVQNDFVNKYNDISNNIEKNPYASLSWKEYSKSLTQVVDRNSDRHRLFSTREASDYFSFNALTTSIDIASWQNLGGIFTGMGILGTFIGLTLGLCNVDLSGTNPNEMAESIKNLLRGVSTAFITSLVGVAFAIGFNYFHNKTMSTMHENTNRLISIIESMYPRYTAESWLKDLIVENQKQTETLETFSGDLAIALGDVLNQQMDQSFQKLVDNLQPLFVDLRASIDKLNSSGIEKVGEKISMGAGEELKGFAKTLVDIQESLQQSMKSSQNMADTTNKNFVDMMNSFADKISSGSAEAIRLQKESVQNTSKVAEETNSRLADLLTEFSKNITDSTNDAMLAQQKHMNETMTEVKSLVKEIQESAKDTSDNLSSTIGQVANNFRDTIDGSTQAQKDSINEICLGIKQVLGEVNENIKTATEKMVEASATANTALLKSVAALQENTGNMTSTFTEGAKNQATVMEQATEEMKNNLQIAVEKMQIMLEQHNNVMNNTYDKFEGAARTTDRLVASAGDTVRKFESAAQPVRDAISDLARQSSDTVKATNDFAKKITDQTDRIATISSSNEENLKNLLENLKQAQEVWKEHEKGINGVSRELKGAFDILVNGTIDYNDKVTKGLRGILQEYDKSIAGGMNKFGSLISEINENIENLNDILSKRR